MDVSSSHTEVLKRSSKNKLQCLLHSSKLAYLANEYYRFFESLCESSKLRLLQNHSQFHVRDISHEFLLVGVAESLLRSAVNVLINLSNFF